MVQSKKINSLQMSLMPAFFAAGCCATTPLMLIFGFTAMDYNFWEYRWYFRFAALVIFMVSIVWYLYKKGLTDVASYKENSKQVCVLILQTLLYSLAIYGVLLYLAVPEIMKVIGERAGSCCGV